MVAISAATSSRRTSARIGAWLSTRPAGKRQVVVVVRERNGKSLQAVFRNEADALGFIRSRVNRGTTLYADEAGSWNDLHSRFEMFRINHQEAYSDGIACTNEAESFFSRMHRAEIGHHHHIVGPYLIRYAQEASRREITGGWRAGSRLIASHHRAGDEGEAVGRFLRLVAAFSERIEIGDRLAVQVRGRERIAS